MGGYAVFALPKGVLLDPSKGVQGVRIYENMGGYGRIWEGMGLQTLQFCQSVSESVSQSVSK